MASVPSCQVLLPGVFLGVVKARTHQDGESIRESMTRLSSKDSRGVKHMQSWQEWGRVMHRVVIVLERSKTRLGWWVAT